MATVVYPKSSSLPMLPVRPLSTGSKPLSAFLGPDGLPIVHTQQAEVKTPPVADEIDTILEQSRRVRDQFARKRTNILRQYQESEKDAEVLWKSAKGHGAAPATRCVVKGRPMCGASLWSGDAAVRGRCKHLIVYNVQIRVRCLCDCCGRRCGSPTVRVMCCTRRAVCRAVLSLLLIRLCQPVHHAAVAVVGSASPRRRQRQTARSEATRRRSRCNSSSRGNSPFARGLMPERSCLPFCQSSSN
jgi:hypothetical protein